LPDPGAIVVVVVVIIPEEEEVVGDTLAIDMHFARLQG
jgi:hypothetical protein